MCHANELKKDCIYLIKSQINKKHLFIKWIFQVSCHKDLIILNLNSF